MASVLIVLSVIPALGGTVRVAEVSGGAEITPENARFFAEPVPLLVHIPTAVLFCVLGALQFVPRLRGRGWHRRSGRVLVPCGLIAALSGLWLTLSYPDGPGDGVLLYLFRLVFGSAWTVSLVLGYLAIRRRDIARHHAWMIRGYAIGQGAGTQAFTQFPLVLIAGSAPTGTVRALLLGAAWVINVAVAEWIIRRRPARPARPGRPVPTQLTPREI